MKTEPNKSLQTISCSVTVAAEPLCVPPHEMSDLKRSAMKYAALLFATALMFIGCTKQDSVTFLEGVFRSEKPLGVKGSVYLEAIFTRDGHASLYTVDSSGRRQDRDRLHERYRIEGNRLIFFLTDAPDGVLYDPPSLLIHDSTTIRAVDGEFILRKQK